MEQSFKRLKSCEGEEENRPENEMSPSLQGKEDFSAVLSSWAQINKNSIGKLGEVKLLQTKNSTNDDWDWLNPSKEVQEAEGDDFGFRIKSGIAKLKNIDLENDAIDILNNNVLDDPHPLTPNLTSIQEEEGPRKEFLERLMEWKRFSSEFHIQEFEMPIPNSKNLNLNEEGYTGKSHLIWENIYDKNSYTIRVIDPSKYTGDYMKDIYALSAIRDGNPFVWKYFGCWREQGLFFIQTERTDQTLGKMMDEGELEQDKIRQLLKDILSAIEYCHTKGVWNLSISVESIFYSNGRFKLNSLETWETNSEVSAIEGTKGLDQMKDKDMQDFCNVLVHLFSHPKGETLLHAQAELFQVITGLAEGKSSLAEFFE